MSCSWYHPPERKSHKCVWVWDIWISIEFLYILTTLLLMVHVIALSLMEPEYLISQTQEISSFSILNYFIKLITLMPPFLGIKLFSIQLNIEPVLDYIHNYQNNWIQHIYRMPRTRFPRTILFKVHSYEWVYGLTC